MIVQEVVIYICRDCKRTFEVTAQKDYERRKYLGYILCPFCESPNTHQTGGD